MATKFVRALPYTTGAPPKEVPLLLRLFYEFWGYCINGTASLTTPGGFPSNPSGNPSTLPANFLEGTTVLATGSNGVTVAGSPQFTSATASFTPSLVGKYLVLWKAGSNSQDDSIYPIIGYNSANTIVVNTGTGGVPGVDLKPTFSSRSSINYRIVDPVAASQLAVAVGNYLVFQTTASNVNVGQPNSQFQIILRDSVFRNLGIVMSPQGSWNGINAFGADASTEMNPVSSSTLWISNAFNTVTGYVTMIGDKDFLMVHDRSGNHSGTYGGILHIEIPYRLYTQAQDSAPIACLVDAISDGLTPNNTGSGYGGGFKMLGQDNVTRTVRTLVRTLHGDGSFANESGVPGHITDSRIAFNSRTGKVVASEALFSMVGTVGQYAIGRCKSKNLRFVGTAVPQYHRVGDAGEFIHVANGICWPWDNSILAFNLLPLGV